jgi:hypothetical protein
VLVAIRAPQHWRSDKGSVYQTVFHGPPEVRGGHQAVSDESTAIIVSDTERMNNTPTHVVLKLPLSADLQQKVGELLISITYCPSVIIL